MFIRCGVRNRVSSQSPEETDLQDVWGSQEGSAELQEVSWGLQGFSCCPLFDLWVLGLGRACVCEFAHSEVQRL